MSEDDFSFASSLATETLSLRNLLF